MNVADKGIHDLAEAGRRVGAHRVNHLLGELGPKVTAGLSCLCAHLAASL